MRIALAQTHIKWEDKNENYIITARLVREAKDSGADMVCFPEMSFTGFSMNIQLTGEKNQETISVMRDLAQKNEIGIGFGWVCLQGEKAKNHYSVVDQYGNLLSDYAKIHPFSYGSESGYFEGGDKLVQFEFGGYHFSNFICYDLRFPEIFQIASRQADIIIVPANWPKAREEHWKTLLKARAIENQSYILGINCVGTIGGLDYSGCSMAVSPNGEVLTILENSIGLLYVDIDSDTCELRHSFPVKNDRKWELYCRLNDEV